MGDPLARRNARLGRLREQLKKKRESLADQFDFKMYIIFHFKEKKKPNAVFEVSEVVPVMTNNYEEAILQGAKNQAYTLESTQELLDRDVVQLHAPRWQSLRKDIMGCTTGVDFFLWPRNDIDRVECRLFSKWKESDDEPYKPLQARFEFSHDDYEGQLLRLLTRREKRGLIINNTNQSVFLFVDRHHLETSKNTAIVFKMSSICLYLPQDQLMHWGPGTREDILHTLY